MARTSKVITVNVQPAAQPTLFSMDYSASADPNAGWTAESTSLGPFTRTRVASGGPAGQDAYDLAQYYSPTFRPEFFGGQFRWGWAGNVETSDPARGVARFYRFRLRFSATTNFRGIDWGDGTSPSSMTNKLLMVGDGGAESRCRVIVEYRGVPDAGNLLRLRINIDGGVDAVDTGPWPLNTWLNVQIEAKSSTNMSTPDGYFRMWVNNNSYASPSANRPTITLSQANWRFVRLGAYASNGLMADGVHTIRLADFQAAESFDSGWNS